ncbi:hypothetical protein HanPI659440_Chr16g0660361 [Helianthus annuus]|nr:hypothetical protein HanPI659440_Chr16g0660361 [Helianthus annuus]
MSMVGAIKKAKPSPGVPLTGNMLTRKEVLKEATVELEVESPSQSLKRRLNMIRPDWLWRCGRVGGRLRTLRRRRRRS